MQLYWSMERSNWDSRPRPFVPGAWSDALAETSDRYAGEPLLGPW